MLNIKDIPVFPPGINDKRNTIITNISTPEQTKEIMKYDLPRVK